MSETKYYVDNQGIYLGGFDGSIPDGGIEVNSPPEDVSYIWLNNAWTIPKPTLNSHLATYRYNKEIGGIVLNGLAVPTDDRTKTLLVGAYNDAIYQNDLTIQRQFKIGGSFITLTNADVIGIALAVAQHVQKCFNSESSVWNDIDANVITTKSGIETSFDAAYAAQ